MAPRNRKSHSDEDKRMISIGMKRAHARGVYDHLLCGVKPCEACGVEIAARKGKRFCSSKCAAMGTAKQRSDKTRVMSDVERRLKAVLKRRIMYHRQRVTMPQLLEWLGCSLKELAQRLESLWQPGMSWDNYGVSGWHIDHIKARAEFNLLDDAQAAVCFHHTNLQPLWREDNQEKENRRRARA